MRGTETEINMEQSLQLGRIFDVQGIFSHQATAQFMQTLITEALLFKVHMHSNGFSIAGTPSPSP